jgi:hypothetical protein
VGARGSAPWSDCPDALAIMPEACCVYIVLREAAEATAQADAPTADKTP